MTTAPRGARTVAPNSQPSPATADAPEAQPRVACDDAIEILAGRVRDGGTLSALQVAALRGAGSRADAPTSLAADLGLVGFCDYRDLAQATVEADASRQRLTDTALRIAKGASTVDESSRALFLSTLRNLRGNPPSALLAQLGLAETAGWHVVYVAHGSPFEIKTKDNQISFVYNDKATMAFAVEMTGHDEIVLGSLAARDWLKLRTKITDVILGVLGTDGPFADSNESSPS